MSPSRCRAMMALPLTSFERSPRDASNIPITAFMSSELLRASCKAPAGTPANAWR